MTTESGSSTAEGLGAYNRQVTGGTRSSRWALRTLRPIVAPPC